VSLQVLCAAMGSAIPNDDLSIESAELARADAEVLATCAIRKRSSSTYVVIHVFHSPNPRSRPRARNSSSTRRYSGASIVFAWSCDGPVARWLLDQAAAVAVHRQRRPRWPRVIGRISSPSHGSTPSTDRKHSAHSACQAVLFGGTRRMAR